MNPSMTPLQRIQFPLIGHGPIAKWNKALFEKRREEFVNVVAQVLSEIQPNVSKDHLLKRTITLGRVLQIGWFRRLPNDVILSQIEQQFQIAQIASKSRPLASAVAKTLI